MFPIVESPPLVVAVLSPCWGSPCPFRGVCFGVHQVVTAGISGILPLSVAFHCDSQSKHTALVVDKLFGCPYHERILLDLFGVDILTVHNQAEHSFPGYISILVHKIGRGIVHPLDVRIRIFKVAVGKLADVLSGKIVYSSEVYLLPCWLLRRIFKIDSWYIFSPSRLSNWLKCRLFSFLS